MSNIRRIARGAAATALVALALGLLVSKRHIVLRSVEKNITPRAAFLVEDDFEGGAGDGWHPPDSLVAAQPGAVRVDGLAIHNETMELSTYRMDFEAKVASGGVSWILGAQNSANYHLYKLEKSGQSKQSYRVVHYPVVEGKSVTTQTVSKAISLEPVEEDFHQISVRVSEGRIMTMIDGRSVDHWTPLEWNPGGIGFFGAKGGSSLIRYVVVHSNQDFWGMSLAATLITIHCFEDPSPTLRECLAL